MSSEPSTKEPRKTNRWGAETGNADEPIEKKVIQKKRELHF